MRMFLSRFILFVLVVILAQTTVVNVVGQPKSGSPSTEQKIPAAIILMGILGAGFAAFYFLNYSEIKKHKAAVKEDRALRDANRNADLKRSVWSLINDEIPARFKRIAQKIERLPDEKYRDLARRELEGLRADYQAIPNQLKGKLNQDLIPDWHKFKSKLDEAVNLTAMFEAAIERRLDLTSDTT